MSKHTNDNAFMLVRLREKGAKLLIITSASLGQKGSGRLPTYEIMDGIPIYRLYRDQQEIFLFPSKKLRNVLATARAFKPDLILCSQELNMRLALLIQKFLKKPIVLLVEDAGRIFSGEAYPSLKMKTILGYFGIPLGGSRYWSWLCRKAEILITCHPRDQQILASLSMHKKQVFYLPWPSYVPDGFQYAYTRDKRRGIYVGSLYPFKNTQEFERTLPLILEKTNTEQFTIVGPGPHSAIIKALKRRYGNSIQYINQLSRTEALKLISGCFYAYTPVKIGGWGFIGDCWSMRTPIVMTHNDNYVTSNVNALVARNENDLVENIRRLYNDPELYGRLQRNGYEEYTKRKADAIGDKLYCILEKAL